MNKIAYYLCLILLACSVVHADSPEPTTEFDKPGFNPGHAYDGVLPTESIDLFTGGLQIDIPILPAQTIAPFGKFAKLLSAHYSSKIRHLTVVPGACVDSGIPAIDPDGAGLGWTLHFGRLWDFNTVNPVLELPDGTRQYFYIDTSTTNQYISKGMWILRTGSDATGNYMDAISPGPESITIRFYDLPAYEDTRADLSNIRHIMHAYSWIAHGPATADTTISFTYQTNLGILVPSQVHQTCSDDVQFTGYGDTGFSIVVPGPNGAMSVHFTTGISDQTLESISREGLNYSFLKDPATLELTRMIVSRAPGDPNPTIINYTYATHEFPTSPSNAAKRCARVITQKVVTNPDSTTDTWTYAYPGLLDSDHIVTVTDPHSNVRKVKFRGYYGPSTVVWDVANILNDETFQGSSTSLVKDEFTYDFKEISASHDPETGLNDTIKIPVRLTAKHTYSQTGESVTRSYGASTDYDRFGNPSFEDYTVGTSLVRSTLYTYAHSDQGGIGDDPAMISENFTHALTSATVVTDRVNPTLSQVSKVEYGYFNTPGSAKFGLVSQMLTWDNETASPRTIKRTYDYDAKRQLNTLSDFVGGSAARTTTYNPGCSTILLADDGLTSQAGHIFNATKNANVWMYDSTISPNGDSTSYSYDDIGRLTVITPPSGDITQITYTDSAGKVEADQGTSHSEEIYDARGRILSRTTKIASTANSYQTFSYDAFDNLLQESEKSLSPTPSTQITRTYDALNRVSSVVTADGTTTYVYNGPDVNVTVSDEHGSYTTQYDYDAAGKLLTVKEPLSPLFTTTYTYDALDRLKTVAQSGISNRTFVYSSRGKLLSETHPESGTTTYQTDELGRTTSKTYQGGSAINYTFDIRDRLLTVNYPTDVDTTFYYDGLAVPGFSQTYQRPKSHLTGMVDAAGLTAWTQFSDRDQLILKKIKLNQISTFPITTPYSYDSRGNLSSIGYPSGQSVTMSRNDANAIQRIQHDYHAGSTDLVTNVDYNAGLLPNLINYANGVSLTITPDGRNRPSDINSSGKLHLNYVYNGRGLIRTVNTSQNNSAFLARDFVYDGVGRISTFNSDAGFVTYNYDAFGNMTQKTAPPPGGPPIPQGPFSYTNNKIDGVSYSASGNQLSANGGTLVYNEDNRLKQVTKSSVVTAYTYDGTGNRASSIGAESHFFVYDEAGGLLADLRKETSGSVFIDKEYVNGPTGTLVTADYEEQRGSMTETFGKLATTAFNPQSGTWTVPVANTYRGTITTANWAVSLSCANCKNSVIKVDANTATTGVSGKNAFIIFDYTNTSNFKFAGFDVVLAKWVIGDVIGGVRTNRATSIGAAPAAGTTYTLEVRADSTTGNVLLKSNNITKCVFLFSSWTHLNAGLGLQGATPLGTTSNFSNFSSQLAFTKAFSNQEDFSDGVANGYTVVQGTWTIVSGVYKGTGTLTLQAISKTPVSSNSATTEMDVTPPLSGRAWVLFDYVDATHYKFAGMDTSASVNQWQIGDVVGTTVTIRNSGGGTASGGGHITLRLEATNTATLIFSNTVKAQWTFAAAFGSNPIALYSGVNLQSSFDNVAIYTDAAPVYSPTYANGPFVYHLNDHLGSTRILTDQTGAVIASYEYFPFGEAKAITGCSAFNDQRFTGKLLDNESTLQYFGARFLSNDLTRFTSVDPSGSSFNPKNPQSLNRFAYAKNDPVNRIDRDGRADAATQPWFDYHTNTIKKDFNGFNKGDIQGAFDDTVMVIFIAATVYDFWITAPAALEYYGIRAQESQQVIQEDVAAGEAAVGVDSNFAVTPKGEAIKIPTGAKGPTAPNSGTGQVYQGGSGGPDMDEKVTGVRIMDADKNQGPRVNYMNKADQTVDPATGRTISRSDPRGHIPLEQDKHDQ